MIRMILTTFFQVLSGLMGGFGPRRKKSAELIKLRLSILYLKCIKTARLLVINVVGFMVCMVLFIAGIILFHLAILLCSPWSAEFKMKFTFLCAAVYIVVSGAIIRLIISEENWLKIFHAHTVLKEVHDLSHPEAAQEKEEKPPHTDKS